MPVFYRLNHGSETRFHDSGGLTISKGYTAPTFGATAESRPRSSSPLSNQRSSSSMPPVWADDGSAWMGGSAHPPDKRCRVLRLRRSRNHVTSTELGDLKGANLTATNELCLSGTQMSAKPNHTPMTRAESTAATREGIIRAARTLLFADRSYDDVTLTEIAAAAGVSHQTVLNHFESKEGVALAVFDELGAEIRAARYRLRPGNVKRMVKALVEEYDRVGEPTVRWLAAALRRERLAVVMESGRVEHQRWLAFMFDDRLPKNPAARRRALNALHAATDVYVWHLLRRDLRASRAETEKTMTDLVFGVLEDVSR